MKLDAQQTANYKIIKPIMDKYGVPEVIWFPIAYAESKLRAGALNDNGENSRGIFQINLKAHPQYAGLDLYNPAVNAEIAAKVFVSPAYEYSKTLTTDIYRQALITYSGLKDPLNESDALKGYVPSGGIMPKWTQELIARFTSYFDSGVAVFNDGTTGGVYLDGGSGNTGGTTIPDYYDTIPTTGTNPDRGGGGRDSTTQLENYSLNFQEQLTRLGIIVTVILIMIFAVFSLVKNIGTGDIVDNITKAMNSNQSAATKTAGAGAASASAGASAASAGTAGAGAATSTALPAAELAVI